MNNLFIIQEDANPLYKEEVKQSYLLVPHSQIINYSDLTIDTLTDIDVVISNQLPFQWRVILNGLNIVSIVFDDLNIRDVQTDIYIDYLYKGKFRLFAGADFKVSNFRKFNIQFDEIFNLITLLDWDTMFWGFNVSFLTSRHLSQSILYRIDKFIDKNQVKLVEYLCDCHDKRSVSLAEKNGFQFKDIRLSYEKEISAAHELGDECNMHFHLAGEEHIPVLRRLSKDIYKDSRYYFDGNFDNNKIIEFYMLWAEKAVRGEYDDECFLLEEGKEIVGFCTVKYQNSHYASIGLVGVSKDHTGRGLGRLLLNYLFNEMYSKGINKIRVVTQGRNYGAQRLYQKVGFTSYSTELWYHKWF